MRRAAAAFATFKPVEEHGVDATNDGRHVADKIAVGSAHRGKTQHIRRYEAKVTSATWLAGEMLRTLFRRLGSVAAQLFAFSPCAMLPGGAFTGPPAGSSEHRRKRSTVFRSFLGIEYFGYQKAIGKPANTASPAERTTVERGDSARFAGLPGRDHRRKYCRRMPLPMPPTPVNTLRLPDHGSPNVASVARHVPSVLPSLAVYDHNGMLGTKRYRCAGCRSGPDNCSKSTFFPHKTVAGVQLAGDATSGSRSIARQCSRRAGRQRSR